ncbi:hypothetical protein BIY21_19655 [Vibrio ponticus]|uniref:ROK family protein n=1 Tax=Vibrio ponticus TaxID=265668 RepID=A0ABX3F4P9_9VIBR|nr:N-acetylmannosamine kinase [Vibrio ponticus]OLQ84943.1 hypothetical protein BIY21_19655 [Vibrio ponticus]
MTVWLSIDIGGTKISAAKIFNNQIVENKELQTPKTNGSHQIIKDVLVNLISKYKGDVEYCSIATAGVVVAGRVRAMSANNLWGHKFFDLKTLVEGILNVPTYIINDAQAAAYCEYIKSDRKGDMGFITVSTGVGGGLVINGQLLTGCNGVAGHIGHSQISYDGVAKRCKCGRDNCLEVIASGTAIAMAMEKETNHICTAKDVFERYRLGDEVAKRIIEMSASSVADAIADLKVVLDLEYIVIGGSVGLAEGYVELIQLRLSQLPEIYQISVTTAVCRHSSGLLGAYLWAKNIQMR